MENRVDIRLKDLNKVEQLTLIEVLTVINRLVYLGVVAIPDVLGSKIYNYTNIKISNIYKETDTKVLNNYFDLLLSFVSLQDEEKDLFLSLLEDENGISIKKRYGIENALNVKNLFVQMLIDIWTYKINVPSIYDPILKNYAEKELTLSNYLYLKGLEG